MMVTLLLVITLVAPSDCDAVNAMLLQAVELRSTGQLEDAATGFRKAAECHPADANVLRELAVTLSWQNRLTEAIEAYNAVLERQPSDRGALLGRARVLAWSGDLARARAEYGALALLDPNDPEALNGLALVYRSRWKLSKARNIYASVLALDSTNAEAREGLQALSDVRRYRIDASVGGTLVDDGRRVAGSRVALSVYQGPRTTWSIGISSSAQSLSRGFDSVSNSVSVGVSRRLRSDWTWGTSYRLRALETGAHQAISSSVSRQLASGKINLSLRTQWGRSPELSDHLVALGTLLRLGSQHHLLLQAFRISDSSGYQSSALVLGARFARGRFSFSPSLTRLSDDFGTRVDGGIGLDASIGWGFRAGVQGIWAEGADPRFGLSVAFR